MGSLVAWFGKFLHLYGAEVWVCSGCLDAIEQVQIAF